MKACIIFKRFISQEYKRHYFQRGERCPCGHDSRCNTGEIKMMECTRDTADKVNGTGRNRCYGTCTVRYETKCYENKGHQRSREYFKESFYPKVNNPPAPVFHDCQVAVFSVEKTWSIENTDHHNGENKGSNKVFIPFIFESTNDAAHHEYKPK